MMGEPTIQQEIKHNNRRQDGKVERIHIKYHVIFDSDWQREQQLHTNKQHISCVSFRWYCLMLLSTFRCELTFNAINMSVKDKKTRKKEMRKEKKAHKQQRMKTTQIYLTAIFGRRKTLLTHGFRWAYGPNAKCEAKDLIIRWRCMQCVIVRLRLYFAPLFFHDRLFPAFHQIRCSYTWICVWISWISCVDSLLLLCTQSWKSRERERHGDKERKLPLLILSADFACYFSRC